MSAPKQDAKADQWSGLEALAKAATPGPWVYADNAPVSYGSAWLNSADVKNLAVCDGTRRSETHGFCLKMNEDENERNAAFIAAANPDQVLELIAAARASTVGMSAANEPKPSPKGCDVELRDRVRATLSWLSGEIGAAERGKATTRKARKLHLIGEATNMVEALINQARQPEGAGQRTIECGWCNGRKTVQTPSTDFTVCCAHCKGTGVETYASPTDNADGLSDDRARMVDAIQAFYLIDWNRTDAEELADAILATYAPPAGKDLAGEVERLRAALAKARWYVNDHHEAQPNDEARDDLAAIDAILEGQK